MSVTTKTLSPNGAGTNTVTMPGYDEAADIQVINTDLSNITDAINNNYANKAPKMDNVAFAGDIDTLKTPGRYYINNGSSTLASMSGLYGTLFVMGDSTDNGTQATQLFIGVSSDDAWYRRLYANGWGNIQYILRRSDIANNLTTTAANKVLDARMGKTLSEDIGRNTDAINTLADLGTTFSSTGNTLASAESALATLGASMVNSQFKNIRISFSTAGGVFTATTYFGTLKRFSATRFAVELQSAGTDPKFLVTGIYNSGTWTWAEIYNQLASLITVVTESTGTISETFASNEAKTLSYSFTPPTGYQAIGIVSITKSGSAQSQIVISGYTVSTAGAVSISLRNTESQSRTLTSMSFKILYQKT